MVNRRRDEEARERFEEAQERRRNMIRHAPPKSNCWRTASGTRQCSGKHSIWNTPEEFGENLL